MRSWKSLVVVAVGSLFLASSTCYAGTIYACRKKVNGQLRVVSAANPCLKSEIKMSWPDTEAVTALQAQVTELQLLLQHFSRVGNDIAINGANLWITNGLGTTAVVNGLGNLIIGYNESRTPAPDVRNGSHNLVVGDKQNYGSYGGILAGYTNSVLAPYAAVSGGENNTASGLNSSVSGGTGITQGDVNGWSGGAYSTP
jgi:hypothetical protein